MIVWKLFSKLPFHAGVHIRPAVTLFSRRYSSDSFFSRHFIRIFSRLRLKMSQQGERMVETPGPSANGITETKLEVVDNDKKEREIPDKYRIKPDLRLVWIDCEMTGLEPGKDRIIEVACIITDKSLKPVHEGFERIVHCPKELMDSMDDWCVEHHGNSGLTAKVLASTNTAESVENELLEYIKEYVPKGSGYLAGNSVHFDKEFMTIEFPQVIDWLHYRIVDVSTIKVLTKLWNSQMKAASPEKKYEHRALEDIKESIMELQYYKENLWKITQ